MDKWLDKGLDARNYEKHRETLTMLFLGAHPLLVDSVAITLLNVITRLATFLFQLPLAPLAPPACSPHLPSLAHGTRLVIPGPVHAYLPSPLI
jgi:hypothetical protein